jgi:hypothetical protein
MCADTASPSMNMFPNPRNIVDIDKLLRTVGRRTVRFRLMRIEFEYRRANATQRRDAIQIQTDEETRKVALSVDHSFFFLNHRLLQHKK